MLGIAAGAAKTETMRHRMDEIIVEDEISTRLRSRSEPLSGRVREKRKMLLNEAKKIAFSNDTQLLGAGNRKLSMGTGGLRRMSCSLYDEIPIKPGSEAVTDYDYASDDEECPAVEQCCRDGKTLGEDLSTLTFREQVRQDLQLLQGETKNLPKLETEEHAEVASVRPGFSKLMMQEQVANRIGISAANAKYSRNSQKGRFQAVHPSPDGGKKKKRMFPPNPLRLLMSPISHRKGGVPPGGIPRSPRSPVSQSPAGPLWGDEIPHMSLDSPPAEERGSPPAEREMLDAHAENMLAFGRIGSHLQR
jgi:hypothetical protein